MIALGDVSFTGKEITVTHTRYAFVKANRNADIASSSLDGFSQLIPVQQVDVFDASGADVLARDRDKHRLVAMATAGCQSINLTGTG
ncbi:MAG: hypothetical protein HY852_02020 [Bradyrhizobium sp.]|nr:hypothetical protein [Bradyrhizobium sp.]